MFSGGSTFTLFRIRGIRIAVDWSWFIVLFLVIFWLSDFYGDVLDKPSGATEPYLLAVASAIGFFGSIVLHELGHAFEAQRHGIGITTIRLWIFGGMAQMDRESDSPGTEFKVAAAGPAMTLLIAILLIAYGVFTAGVSDFRDAMELKLTADTTGITTMIAWLASINLIVLAFNLLPAFPLDGGRILRALLALRLDYGQATALAAGVEIEWVTGSDLTEAHWDAFFAFYMDTGGRKWGRPYLNRRFFSLIGERMPEDILLVMAKRDGRYIAGALNLIGSDRLYGRNWGCIEDHPFRQFEGCYHQAIDFAIANRLAVVEAGAQGEHKLSRGYMPVPMRSAHFIVHPGLRRAVADLARQLVRVGNKAVVEGQLRGRQHPHAHLVNLAPDVQARKASLDEKDGQLLFVREA